MQAEYASVSELNTSIKKYIDATFNKTIIIKGELSNVKHAEKHFYATLRDNSSCIDICFWYYSQKSDIKFSNGDNVTVHGKISVYVPNGKYSISMSHICKHESVNEQSNIHTKYNDNKMLFDKKGYFRRKLFCPTFIKNIGIITANNCAALHDVLYVLNQNNFAANIYIKPCIVQGQYAENSIIEALQFLKNYKLDIILLTRGGGSFEDLCVFSSPAVIEEIYNRDTYLISAIGHEIDFMLSDFVADVRAPTPSVAAEIISNINKSHIDSFAIFKAEITDHVQHMLNESKKKILSIYDSCVNILASSDSHNILQEERQKMIHYKQLCNDIITANFSTCAQQLNRIQTILNKHNTVANLNEGFAVVTKGYSIIDSSSELKSGQKLKIKFKDGDINVIVL